MKVFTNILTVCAVATATAASDPVLRGADDTKRLLRKKHKQKDASTQAEATEAIPRCEGVGQCNKLDGTCGDLYYCLLDPCDDSSKCAEGQTCKPDYCGGCNQVICTSESGAEIPTSR